MWKNGWNFWAGLDSNEPPEEYFSYEAAATNAALFDEDPASDDADVDVMDADAEIEDLSGDDIEDSNDDVGDESEEED
jgi:hypothetical protein